LRQAQKAAFRFHLEVELVVFRPADRAQQNGIGGLRLGHRCVRQRRAMRVIGAAAHQILAHIEGKAALGAEPADDLLHFAHDFGPDAVTGEEEEGGVGHGLHAFSLGEFALCD